MSKEKRLIPKRRFKGFENAGAWEQCEFSHLAARKSELSNSANLPTIQYEDIKPDIGVLIDTYNYSSQNKTGLIFQKNDILFGKLRPYLKNWYLANFTGIAVGDFWVLESIEKEESQFLFYLLQTNHFMKIANQSIGTKMPRADWKTVSSEKFRIPKQQAEKIRIGFLFSTIDRIITLHQRKLEKLKSLKKSYLSAMFPAEGQRKPKLRYKGFTNDWEQRELGKMSERVIVGLATSVTPYYRDHGVPILRNLNIKPNYLDDYDLLYLDSNYADAQTNKKIHKNDVLTVHTGHIGISCLVPEKYDNCLTFTTLITTPKRDILDSAYLVQFLNSELGKEAIQAVTTQGGRQNLNTNDFVKVLVLLPPLKEQKQIADFCATIDRYITLHQRKRK